MRKKSMQGKVGEEPTTSDRKAKLKGRKIREGVYVYMVVAKKDVEIGQTRK